jgi:hypothetical protein
MLRHTNSFQNSKTELYGTLEFHNPPDCRGVVVSADTVWAATFSFSAFSAFAAASLTVCGE